MSGRQVIITAMGASMFASIPLEYLLNSCGIQALLIEAGELLHYRQPLCKDAVLVIVSRSGESIEIVKLVENLKGQCKIIGISNNPQSVLAKRSDISIHVGSLPDEMVAIQSYSGTVLVLYLLGLLAQKKKVQENAELCGVLAQLPSLIQDEENNMREWDELLSLGSPIYLLGRGPSWGSVLEGALLFHEMAKFAAVGMPTGSFRHGPVEVVDDRFTGLVFAPAGQTRELNLGLAQDVARFGGHVRVIGPKTISAGELAFHVIPEVNDYLAPLVEIIPVQFAALRLAQLRGLEIGKFRYTPQVARDEMSFTA